MFTEDWWAQFFWKWLHSFSKFYQRFWNQGCNIEEKMSSWVRSHLHLCNWWALKQVIIFLSCWGVWAPRTDPQSRSEDEPKLVDFVFFRIDTLRSSRQDESQIPTVLRHRKGLRFTESTVGLTLRFLFYGPITVLRSILSLILCTECSSSFSLQDNQPAVTRRADDGDANLWWECFPPCLTFASTFTCRAFSKHCLSKATYNKYICPHMGLNRELIEVLSWILV